MKGPIKVPMKGIHRKIRCNLWRMLSLLSIICIHSPLSAEEANNRDLFDGLLGAAASYQLEGYSKKALPLLFKAQQISRFLTTDEQVQGHLLLGRLYFEIGEYPLSAQQLDKVAKLSSDPYVRAEALNTVGAIHSTLNTPSEAEKAFAEAMKFAAEAKSSQLQLTIQTNELRHQLAYGNQSIARMRLAPSWQTLQNQRASANTTELNISLAILYHQSVLNAKAKPIWRARAIQLLEEAISTSESLGNNLLLGYALGYKGRVLSESSNSEKDLATALALSERAAFLASASQAYESAYLWQWQAARIYNKQAQVTEAIKSYNDAILTLENVRQELITGSPFTFHQKVQPLFTELSDLLLTTARAAGGAEKQSYLKNVQNILEQAKSAELQDYFQNDCVIPDESVNLDQIEAATAVIYPVILPDRVEVLVNVRDQVHQFVSRIEAGDLKDLVNEFRDQLQVDFGDEEYLEIGEELYDLLFAQVEDLFSENKINTLLVIPDGVLRTIPMAAVYDGEAFMVQRFAIATTPGISLTLPKPLNVENSNFFAGGISEAVQGYVGLPGVPRELQNLEATYGASVLRDANFKRDDLKEQLTSADYSIVHIATHGHFDSNPQESYLLTYDDKLTMDLLEESIGNRKNVGEPLELLVLSACETAAGDSRAALGLAGVALKAGARSAVATLWQISDAATVEIIDTFYEYTAKEGVTKARAMQLAQIRLIEQPRFQHPTDWAPFLMIGNWL
ncbi:CHAT domain-containing protein [Pseudomonadales bacterium]|jgi:CHAT domain-containing protein|nr:CHAT domain-containing protein [Gammaproteobacteria bacterium]MDC0995026.1 CHAT domain-containing protein [Pseudomonadales bacterium]MDC1017038.1 CHAT domain-containing protein [Pseudomonadales bacterium]